MHGTKAIRLRTVSRSASTTTGAEVTTKLLLPILAMVLATTAACGGDRRDSAHARPFELSIFDPANAMNARLTINDVVRSSARAEAGETAEAGLLYFRLTRTGLRKFRQLTRELAKRGKRLHRLQSFAIEVNHQVYARPRVDYKVFPDGLDASQGIEINGLQLSLARRLASGIRRS
jgi:hypothetical protein